MAAPVRPRFPARLHVLLARDAPAALVIRRGPANAVCSVGWNRETGEFTLGQWKRGRIYERRCDLSPDGRHWIYFTRGGGPDKLFSWTAIARVPWMKAVVLHPKGDCWQGGGLFTSASTYWLNGGACHGAMLEQSPDLTQDCAHQPCGHYGGECPGVYYVRLQRDGWAMTPAGASAFDRSAVFEKPLPDGWVLRKFAHAQTGPPPGRGCYWDEHEVEHAGRGLRMSFPAWEWAEWDGRSLYWAERGVLHASGLSPDGLADERVLFDFNGMNFDRRTAPY